MPTVNRADGLLAEFAVFPTHAESQARLIELVIQIIESTLKQAPGFVSATVFRSRDEQRVTSYVQWSGEASYVAMQPIPDFETPDVHLYDIFAEEPEESAIALSPDMEGLVNFGIFKMKHPENQARFIELFCQALDLVSGQPGLIATLSHRSLDGWRCINFGHWESIEAFTAMDSNRPFSPLFGEMLDLANNEYQKDLHEVVFTL